MGASRSSGSGKPAAVAAPAEAAALRSRPKRKSGKAKPPTLAELNRQLAATRAARLKRAEANTRRLTGQSRF